jgi:hypothetical protein
MKRTDWSADTSWDEVKARARGRRRWNVTRRFRAHARRVKVAKRLNQLQEEARAAGSLAWMPRGVIAQLANEFGVNRQTISSDLAAIDRWPSSWPSENEVVSWPVPTQPPPPRKKLRDPRWFWAYSRPRPTTLPRRISVRLPEELYQVLLAKGDPSRIIRQALETFLDGGKAHSRDDCAMALAQAADLDTQDKIVRASERLQLPIWQVVTSLLHVGLRKEA